MSLVCMRPQRWSQFCCRTPADVLPRIYKQTRRKIVERKDPRRDEAPALQPQLDFLVKDIAGLHPEPSRTVFHLQERMADKQTNDFLPRKNLQSFRKNRAD